MKKLGLICMAVITGFSLAGCNNLASQNWHRKHDNQTSASSQPKKHHSSKKISTSSKNESDDDELFDVYDNSSDQIDVSAAKNVSIPSMSFPDGSSVNIQEPQTKISMGNIGNSSNSGAEQAVAAAKAKYGDQNGKIHWDYMIDGTTGQPIKNPDGSYFVKGTADDGTMTGTQYSVNVYPDGSITKN